MNRPNVALPDWTRCQNTDVSGELFTLGMTGSALFVYAVMIAQTIAFTYDLSAVPAFLRPSLDDGQGRPRRDIHIALVLDLAIAAEMQLLVAYMLLAKLTEMNTPLVAMLLGELTIAAGWTLYLWHRARLTFGREAGSGNPDRNRGV